MRKNSLYIISSLFFACVLFIYATSTNFQNSNTTRQVKSETYTNTIANVPIDIHYDDDQYFISGFASEVSVVLTGANRVTLASEMQESTRKFKVTADLTDASVGTIEVPLNIENLPSGLTAVATPQKITVKVGKKVKRDGMLVVPQVDQSQIDSKLQIDSVTVSNERVSVTTDQETLAKIKLDNALELALTTAGARNNLAVKALLKMENIKMDNDKVIGLTEQIEELKKTSDYLFKVEDKTPPAPTGTTPANPNGSGNPAEPKITLGSALGAIYNNNK